MPASSWVRILSVTSSPNLLHFVVDSLCLSYGKTNLRKIPGHLFQLPCLAYAGKSISPTETRNTPAAGDLSRGSRALIPSAKRETYLIQNLPILFISLSLRPVSSSIRPILSAMHECSAWHYEAKKRIKSEKTVKQIGKLHRLVGDWSCCNMFIITCSCVIVIRHYYPRRIRRYWLSDAVANLSR